MLDQKVKILSESLARSMGRRKFLKQAGTTVFGGLRQGPPCHRIR